MVTASGSPSGTATTRTVIAMMKKCTKSWMYLLLHGSCWMANFLTTSWRTRMINVRIATVVPTSNRHSVQWRQSKFDSISGSHVVGHGLDWTEQGLTSYSTHFRSFQRRWGDCGINHDCSRSQSPQCVQCCVVCARPLLLTVVCMCIIWKGTFVCIVIERQWFVDCQTPIDSDILTNLTR